MTSVPELCIISYLLNYNNYIKYIRYISIDKEIHKELKTLYYVLEVLHKKYPNTDKSLDELEAMVYTSYPQMREGEKKVIADLITQLRNVDVRKEILKDVLDKIVQRSAARETAFAFLEVSEGRKTWEDAIHISSQVEQVSSPLDERSNFVSSKLSELKDHTRNAPGLRWPLDCLNLSLGPIRDGDFGFVFARPESGKTTFIAHAGSHMAGQTDRPILWFNNEEQGEKVRLRTFQAALGITQDEIWLNEDETQQAYEQVTKDNIKIYDDASIYKHDVEAIIDELKPALVIFDQIDKIKGFSADRQDLVFGRIYQWARELAKTKHCAVIGICQSDGTGEGIKWLTMSHVAEAKTSKQAEADWILGIGRSNEGGTESVRYFNISKNKLLGDQNTNPELRHGRFDVWIRPEIAQYQDMI